MLNALFSKGDIQLHMKRADGEGAAKNFQNFHEKFSGRGGDGVRKYNDV